jgi:hypothetical protein
MKKRFFSSHKILNNETANLINYVSYAWTDYKEHVFLGFIENISDYVIGVSIEGGNYIPVHCWYQDTPRADGDLSDKESCIKKPYILMFMGDDDCSYFKRFETKDEALAWYFDTENITNDTISQCYFYN